MPSIINELYNKAYEYAFAIHLKQLMWTKEDFYDEVNYYSNYEINSSKENYHEYVYDDDDDYERYYEKRMHNEEVEAKFNYFRNSTYEKYLKIIRQKIIQK